MLPLKGSATVDFGGQSLQLLPDRALYWAAQRAVIVSDVHLGKDTTFRKAGFPIPVGSNEKDLARLSTLLTATAATRLIVLGDLVHAKCAHDPALTNSVTTWRRAHSAVQMLLIRGNHDRRAGRLPTEWDMEEQEEPIADNGYMLSHDPREDQRGPVLSGHVHPVLAKRDFDRSIIRIPCFVFDAACCAILPAFGSLTGGHPIHAAEARRIFITSGKSVVELCIS